MTHPNFTADDLVVTPASPEVRAAMQVLFASRMIARVVSKRPWLQLSDVEAIANAAIGAGFGDRLARAVAPQVQIIATASRRGAPAMP